MGNKRREKTVLTILHLRYCDGECNIKSYLLFVKNSEEVLSEFFILFNKQVSRFKYIREVINISPIKYLIFVRSKEH